MTNKDQVKQSDIRYYHALDTIHLVNSLPYDKILGWSKFKAFADNKMKLLKLENADYQHFLLFPQCFQKAFYSESLKVRIVW